MDYHQNYNPLGHPVLSTLAAALPILTLLYLLALHPTRTREGSRHLGIAAHWAAIGALIVALLVSTIVFRMPAPTAGMSMVYGSMYGLFPIGWIIIGAMFLYTITLVSGLFDVLRDSVAGLSDDPRIQSILIAFSFGAFIEGAAGFGTPVAISGALLVGLGFRPMQAAVLCLIANTAPVAFGGLAIPITALAGVTGIDPVLISQMAARQLPFFSLIVPVWMVVVQTRMDRRPLRDVFAVWPALLVAGGSFAATQFIVGNHGRYFQLVDILGGVASMASLALLLKVWKPVRPYTISKAPVPAEMGNFESPSDVLAYETPRSKGAAGSRHAHPRGRVVLAWLPWLLLTSFVFAWGLPTIKSTLNALPGANLNWPVAAVNGRVYRMPPVVAVDAKNKGMDEAIYKFAWLSAPGTGLLFAAILSGFIAGLSIAQWKLAIIRTIDRLRLPLLTICLILAMGFLTKYSGMDAVLGLAFTRTGWLYPFFAAMLGWLGVALTGSDTSSNIMFGSMQQIAARQAGLDPLLIVTANSTGGVMGKMIDAQSIVVATAACYENPSEGKLAVGPIFRAVLPHSIALAMLVGMLVLLQAHSLKWMVPPH